MLRNGFLFSTFRATLKWNLLLMYAFLIIYTVVSRQKLAYQLKFINSSENTNIPFDVSLNEMDNASFGFYDITHPFKTDFNCVKTRTVPSTTVCLYSQWRDSYISHDLEDTGRWEPQVTDDFLEVLRRDRNVGVFDIGANIGYYSLLAAKMGHQVVAVEPLVDNIHRIHRAALLEKLFDRITVFQNAIANVRMLGTIRTSGDNQGDTRIELGVKPCQGSCPLTVKTVLLDDLVGISPFSRAVMKVDIQGYEHKAFQHAAILFSKVNITYVFMEWLVMKEFFLSSADHQADIVLVEELLSFFFQRKYHPYSLSSDGGHALDPIQWPQWPNDIVWHLLPDLDIKSKLLYRSFYHWPP